jgi:hypothetical protein
MKQSIVGLVAAALLGGLAGGGVTLPEVRPGPFAAVPAAIGGAAAAPAAPLEPSPPALADCRNAPAVFAALGIRLDDAQAAALARDRFILVPITRTSLAEALPETAEDAEWAFTADEMLEAFGALGGGMASTDREPAHARLVTPDVVLHAWHRGFSLALEHIESNRLHALLGRFLDGALANLRELRAAADGDLADRLAWTEARFAAAAVLLGPPPPTAPPPGEGEGGEEEEAEEKEEDGQAVAAAGPPPYPVAVAGRLAAARAGLPAAAGAALAGEIKLVLAAEGMSTSPLFGSYEPGKPADYTQFKPRSHYAKSDAAGAYFRAMMFLGRNGFPLVNEKALGDALLAALALARTPAGAAEAPLGAWRELMEITGFFAGQSDDLTYPELRAWLAGAGSVALEPAAALDPAVLAPLFAKLGDLRRPRIVSSPHADTLVSPDDEPPAFRIFGQRFTWDAHVLSALTRGSPDAMPTTPAAAMVTAAFGCEFSRGWVARGLAGNPRHAAEFPLRLAALRGEIAAVPDAGWFASMAAKQLHVIGTLAAARHPNLPAFMTSPAFAARNLESMLGSYTQLKHDTVLYAKQAYAELGEGGEDAKAPPVVKGLVQPDLPFWREMERLAVFTADGFERHRLLPDAGEEYMRFRVFANDVRALRLIAEKHVAAAPLSEADWETVRTINLSYMAEPMDMNKQNEPGQGKAALVTDIFTDAAEGVVLHLALGRPNIMLALAGGADGPRLLAGVAYDFHEFTRPLAAGRLTDEQWRQMVYRAAPELPAKAPWQLRPLPVAPAP